MCWVRIALAWQAPWNSIEVGGGDHGYRAAPSPAGDDRALLQAALPS
jgi:hypothetical protein